MKTSSGKVAVNHSPI